MTWTRKSAVWCNLVSSSIAMCECAWSEGEVFGCPLYSLWEIWNDSLLFPLPVDFLHIQHSCYLYRTETRTILHFTFISYRKLFLQQLKKKKSTHLVYNLKVAGSCSSTVSTIDARTLSFSSVPSGYAYAGINNRGINRFGSISFFASKIVEIKRKDESDFDQAKRRTGLITWPGEEDGRKDEKLDLWHVSRRDAAQHTSRLYEMHRITTLVDLTSDPSFISRASFFLFLHQLLSGVR